MSKVPEIKLARSAVDSADKVTFAAQDKLPALPVPDINATCASYAATCKAFFSSPEEQEAIDAEVKAFLENDAPALQEQLKAMASQPDCGNWLENMWMELAYMRNRFGVVPNTNYWCLAPERAKTFDADVSQAHIAACYAYAIARFQLEQIEMQQLPVEKAGENPLCMLQYARLLNTVRVPGEEKDTSLNTHPLIKAHITRGSASFEYAGTSAEECSHYLVACNNHYYAVPTYDAENRLLTPIDLQKSFEWILSDAAGREAGPGLGFLGAGDRTRWAKAIKSIKGHSETNAAELARILNAVSVISLDSAAYPDRLDRCRAGMEANGNRWPDHAYQVVVYADGEVSIMGEHSARDATADAVLTAATQKTLELLRGAFKAGLVKETPDAPCPSRINVELPEDVLSALSEARDASTAESNNIDIAELAFTDYGKEAIKQMKCHPDAWVQLALQITFYRVHKRIANTYESGTLRGFFHGRTETVRPLTADSAAFVKALDDPKVPPAKKGALFVRAATAHVTQLRGACTGHGWDRHLLALRVLAGTKGVDVPLFAEGGRYRELSKFDLSTSQFASTTTWGAFAAAERTGYGLPYTFFGPDSIRGWVTAFKDGPDTNAAEFVKAFSNTLRDMQKLAVALATTRQSHVDLKA